MLSERVGVGVIGDGDEREEGRERERVGWRGRCCRRGVDGGRVSSVSERKTPESRSRGLKLGFSRWEPSWIGEVVMFSVKFAVSAIVSSRLRS
jgi:hypothetical protein